MGRLGRTTAAKIVSHLTYALLALGRLGRTTAAKIVSHLTYALLALGRLGRTNAAKIECAHRRARKLLTDYNKKIYTFRSIYDYRALLKAFKTNTFYFHQYFKDKLSSDQPSHMHNTRHRTNCNFNTPLFNHSKTQKSYYFIPSNTHMEQPTMFA